MKMHRRTTVGVRLVTAACTLLFLILSNEVHAETEREAVINHTQNATWAYFTDETSLTSIHFGSRWYISYIGDFGHPWFGGAYSLGPLIPGITPWWTVGDRSTNNGHGAANINPAKTSITAIQNLDNNPSDTFRDIGSGQLVTNSEIHSDRQRLQGKTVPIAWYFFQLPNNGPWYIASAPENGPLQVLRFAEKNGQYDWPPVDVSGLNATFLPHSQGVYTFIGTQSWLESRNFVALEYVLNANLTFVKELEAFIATSLAGAIGEDVGTITAQFLFRLRAGWAVQMEANNGDYISAGLNAAALFTGIFVDIAGGPVAHWTLQIGKLAASFVTLYAYGFASGTIY